MVAVGMLLIWGGYSVTLWGWCLLRNYNVTLGQLMSPVHPYAGKWPPAAIPPGQIWPGSAVASPTGGGVSQQQAGPVPGGQIGVGPGSVTVPFGGFPVTIPVSKTSGGGPGPQAV